MQTVYEDCLIDSRTLILLGMELFKLCSNAEHSSDRSARVEIPTLNYRRRVIAENYQKGNQESMQKEIVDSPVVITPPKFIAKERRPLSTHNRDGVMAPAIPSANLGEFMLVRRAHGTRDKKLRPSTASYSVPDVAKHMLDRVVSAVLIVLLSPIFVITAVAIYLESGSGIIFKQKRSSCKGGPSFDFYKFRSMVRGADEMKDHLQGSNESDGALFKIGNDPRITRVGKIIRKLSIDELPQLFNVLKAEMSLVGPRPLPVSDLEKTQGDPEIWRAMRTRASVKPGITGLWQVCGRSSLGFSTMIMLDLYYVENRCLLLDVKILLKTIPAVLRREGAC